MFSYSPPAREDIEVTVLGGGVGESIVIHLGDGRWVIVDSFRATDRRQPAALEYLRALGVDPDDVVALVSTHWDDDHIRGMTELVAACRLATFSCSAAMLKEEFRALVRAKHPAGPSTAATTRIREIAGILEILKEAGGARGPRKLEAGSTVTTVDWEYLPIRVLAPSPLAVETAQRQFLAALDPALLSRDAVQVLDRNMGSLVLWLETKGRRALLAGDFVPSGGSALLGWHPIIQAASHHERAQLYKVAHHGSPGSHDEQVWSRMLTREPRAAVTAYTSHPDPLPTPASRRRIRTLTPHAVVIGASRRQEMTFLGQQEAELAKRQVRRGTGVIQKAGGPGMARYRAAPQASTAAGWDFSREGNVAPIST